MYTHLPRAVRCPASLVRRAGVPSSRRWAMPSPARRARVPNTARTGPFTPSVRGLRLCRSY